MKISIVLPVYNGAAYLRQALDSILVQTWSDYELIIVDDASTDESPDIIREYSEKDKRIRAFRNEKNRKLPQSLNIGFSHATGDLYTWTSDDNLLFPECLEHLAKVFEEHPETGLVYARQNYIDEKGTVYAERDYPDDPDDIYFKDTVGACFMYRKEVQETLGGYDTSKFLVEDYDFWLRAYEQFRFYYLPEVLYSYRTHKGSLTGQRRIEIKKKAIALRENLLEQKKDPKVRAKLIAGLTYDYMFVSDIYIRKLKKMGEKEMFRHLIGNKLRMTASECLKDKDTFR